MFLGAGLDCNLKTSAGQTPLMLAAFGGHEAIVSFLLEHGGNAEVMDRHRATALVYAIINRWRIDVEYARGIPAASRRQYRIIGTNMLTKNYVY